MRALRVIEFVSLDGVMQSPHDGGDTEGGFRHGGWDHYGDDVLNSAAMEGLEQTDAYLFGRKTYEEMVAYWPTAPSDNPLTQHLNHTPKYIASRTLRKLEWQNSTLIEGDVAKAVAELKEQPGKNIAVLGSGELVQTLIEHDLVDEYFVGVFPLVLGSGKRLFREHDDVTLLSLVDSTPTSTGGVLLTYRRA